MHSPRPHQDANHLDVAVTPRPTSVWVEVVGEVDLGNGAALEEQLDELERAASAALADGGSLDLDLRELAFCDVRGCRMLWRFVAGTRARGIEVRIHGASPSLRKVLALVGDGRDLPFV